MRIAIATVQAPFLRGGAEMHAEALLAELRRRGHHAEIVTIPFKWYPASSLLASMVMARLADLSEAAGETVDLMIGLKFPAYFAPHPNKILWLLHQHRQAYDLWGTPFSDMHTWPDGEYARASVMENDNRYLATARRIFANSGNVARRLLDHNGFQSTVLYHPPAGHERLHAEAYGDFIFYPSRIDGMKRQHLLVEAAAHLKGRMRVVIAGQGSAADVTRLRELIDAHRLNGRVELAGYISEAAKIDLYARCAAVYFGGYDEDYGYVALEGMFAEKAILAHPDSGGALEFMIDGETGYVVDPDPRALAQKIDEIGGARGLAQRLGRAGRAVLREKRVDWDHVVESLLA
jgi:glycosyltransferase involved in cell wall biosynthesis